MALPTIGTGYNSLIGNRISPVDQKTAEYYNLQTGQGFTDPTALSTFVNQNFSGITTSPQNVFTTLGGAYTSPVIKPSQLTPNQPLALPSPNTTTSLNQADASVAGTNVYSTNLQKYIDSLTPPSSSTPEATAAKAITDRLTELYGQDVGKAQALSEAEQTAGVSTMQKDLQNINNSIAIKNAEYEKLNTDIAGNPIPLGLIRGEQAQNRLQQASEINLLSARAQALQGNITLAKDTAAKAVALKYSAIEDEINAKERQLQVIQPLLSAEERKIASAQQLALDQQRTQIAQQKTQQTNNINLALDLGITKPYYEYGGEYRQTASGAAYATPMEFFQAAGIPVSDPNDPAQIAAAFAQADARGLVQHVTQQMINPPKTTTTKTGTAPSTGGYKFTTTQLNNGASNAGVSLTDFKALNPDVQNFFVSSSQSVLNGMNDALSKISSGDLSIEEFNSAVDANNIPQSVKDYLKALAAKRAPTSSGGSSGSSFWQQLWTATRQTLNF